MSFESLSRLAHVRSLRSVPTPAIVGDAEAIRRNIAVALLLIGSPARWRPHIKTARTRWAIQRLIEAGVERYKAATPQELEATLEAGATDVLLAYPVVGPLGERIGAIATQHPGARISILVDDVAALDGWPQGPVRAFLDLDVGEHRTGISLSDPGRVLAVAEELRSRGIELAGLHYYDGHLADSTPEAKHLAVGSAIAAIDRLVQALVSSGHPVAEIVAGSSHTFIPALQARRISSDVPPVVVSPGTIIYSDGRSVERFGGGPFEPSVAVLCRVVSRRRGSVTVDAGLSAIQVDAGFPHLHLLNHPALTPHRPAQEHLVLEGNGADELELGDLLALLPRHLDTTMLQSPQMYLVDEVGGVHVEPIAGRLAIGP
jgi:D-serine deaminase-like pyridoxal phosphate-dependent protein